MSQDLRAHGAKIPDFLDGVSGLGSLWWGAEHSCIGEGGLWLSGPIKWAGNQGWGERGLVMMGCHRKGAARPLNNPTLVRLALESKSKDALVEHADLLLSPSLLTVSSSHVQRHT